MFKKSEIEKIKKQLLDRKVELEEELENLASEKMSDSGSKDDGDHIAAVTMEALRNSLQDTEYNEYKKILEALKAADAGTYGICKECGEMIASKRLKYNMNAQYCLECQEKREEQDDF